MSGCGCKGHYHNGGCSDQNVIWWAGAPHGVPVNPTQQEIDEQVARLKSRMSPEDQAKFHERMARVLSSANAVDK